MNVSLFSTQYRVRRMGPADAEEILRLCRGNTQYYACCGAEASREQILSDLSLTPPGVEPSAKYYVGFYRGDALIAVMDLIDGYPEDDVAFIGFFMTDRALQGRGLGSAIVAELSAYLKGIGKTAIRLGIDKGNPQSTHFWKKNGFAVLREIDRGDWTVLLAEKTL